MSELNLRVAKIIRVGRMRANVGLDVFNLLNVAPILSYDETFIPGETRAQLGVDVYNLLTRTW